MCEMQTILVSNCPIILLTASLCKYWVYPENNMGQNSDIKIQNPSEDEFKD